MKEQEPIDDIKAELTNIMNNFHELCELQGEQNYKFTFRSEKGDTLDFLYENERGMLSIYSNGSSLGELFIDFWAEQDNIDEMLLRNCNSLCEKADLHQAILKELTELKVNKMKQLIQDMRKVCELTSYNTYTYTKTESVEKEHSLTGKAYTTKYTLDYSYDERTLSAGINDEVEYTYYEDGDYNEDKFYLCQIYEEFGNSLFATVKKALREAEVQTLN